MKVLILAGGFATRLWPLTECRAKPLLLLDGKTILAHILEKVPAHAEIYLLTNQAFEQDFRKELDFLKRQNYKIFCEDAYSDGDKLGALKAISVAITEFNIQENVFVLAGDNILPELDLSSLEVNEDEACLAVREVDSIHEAKKFGVVEEKNGEVVAFAEKPEEPKSKLVSTGFISIGKNLFDILHKFSTTSPDALGAIFPEFLQQEKRVLATEVSGPWFDVGSFETYLEAHKTLQESNCKRQENVTESSNKFSGKVFLGKNAVIKNCKILDSIIYPSVRLENCHISQSVIDEGCHLRGLDLNRKLIRKGTTLVNN
ncbi:NDP-sugar synthase [Candidatus Gracilibacteria bacterium]|nr:NDP-sugar synthase [Candidatus Gracilibacteria bacterium]